MDHASVCDNMSRQYLTLIPTGITLFIVVHASLLFLNVPLGSKCHLKTRQRHVLADELTLQSIQHHFHLSVYIRVYFKSLPVSKQTPRSFRNNLACMGGRTLTKSNWAIQTFRDFHWRMLGKINMSFSTKWRNPTLSSELHHHHLNFFHSLMNIVNLIRWRPLEIIRATWISRTVLHHYIRKNRTI